MTNLSVADIAPHRAERDRIRASLEAIYVGFEAHGEAALHMREVEIVDLLNRDGELTMIIETFEAARLRSANIQAGWERVKALRKERTS